MCMSPDPCLPYFSFGFLFFIDFFMAGINQTVYLGSDSDGHELKKLFKDFLQEKGIKAVDLGMFENDTTDFGIVKRELGEKLAEDPNPLGVLIFGKTNKA